MIKTGEFNSMFPSIEGTPKIDAIRNSLKSVKLGSIRKMNLNIVKKAVRNKVLDEGTIDGYTVAAIDGTKLFDNTDPHFDDGSGENIRYARSELQFISEIMDGASKTLGCV